MPNIVFLDAGTDATYDFSLYSSTQVQSGASLTSDSSVTLHGPRAVKADQGGSARYAYAQANGVFGSTGRLSVWVRFPSQPASSTTLLFAVVKSGTPVNAGDSSGSIRVTAVTDAGGGGYFSFGAATGGGSESADSGRTGGTWYRVSAVWRIASDADNEFRFYVDGSLRVTATNAANVSGSNLPTALRVGNDSTASEAGTPGVAYFDSIYADDGTISDGDTGDIRVTAKRYASNSTNNFDTAIGSATNRWDYVSEVPLSTAKGWKQAASTQVAETYGLQASSAGDVDISGATLFGYRAWVYAQGQDVTSDSPKATFANNGKATGTTLTLGVAVVVAGDVAVVAFADLVGGSNPTIADNLGNTWTPLSGPTTNGVRASKWYSAITNAGSMTVTITFGSSAAGRGGVMAVWGSNFVGALDKNATNANDSTTPYDCPTSGTLAQADELVIGFAFVNGPDTNVAAATSPDTLVGPGGSSGGSATTNATAAISWRKVSATTAVAPQFTGTSRAGVVGTASFRVTPVVAGTPKLVDNGSDVSITLSGTPTPYANNTTTSTYPSGAFGMKSSGSGMDTYFYEGGVMVAYIPGAGTPLTATPLMMAGN